MAKTRKQVVTEPFEYTGTQRDWTPVRQGNIYCSPACGGRGATCTWASYQHAERSAAELAKKLGPEWKPEVWENLGWFWAVQSVDGHIRVRREKGERGYEAWVSLEPGTGFVDWSGNGDTALLAISAAIGNLRAHVDAKRVVLDKCLAVFAKTGPGKPR